MNPRETKSAKQSGRVSDYAIEKTNLLHLRRRINISMICIRLYRGRHYCVKKEEQTRLAKLNFEQVV